MRAIRAIHSVSFGLISVLLIYASGGCPGSGGAPTDNPPLVAGITTWSGNGTDSGGGDSTGDGSSTGDGTNVDPATLGSDAVLFTLDPEQGVAPLTVNGSAFTLADEPLPDGQYTWSWGDDTVDDGTPSASHTYLRAGRYPVALLLTLAGATSPIACQYDTRHGGGPETVVNAAIYGRVIDEGGQPLSGVTILANNGASGVSDSNGNYTVVVPPGWTGKLAPQSDDFSFAPEQRTFQPTYVSQADQNFAVLGRRTLGALSVSPATDFVSSGIAGGPFAPASQVYTLTNTGGKSIGWTTGNGQPWMSIDVNAGTLAAGAHAQVTISLNSGANGLSAGTYTDSISFTNTTNGSGNTSRGVQLNIGQQITAVLISGYVTDSGNGLGGVLLAGLPDAVTSDPNGYYSATVASGFSATVTPQKAGYSFAPANRVYTNVATDVDQQDYAATVLANVNISGRVTQYSGSAYAGVQIVFTGTGDSVGADFTTTTLADGTYTQAVPVGWSGDTSCDANHHLQPATRIYSGVISPAAAEDYVGFRNYYVATGGDNLRPGTFLEPWLTIQHAADTVSPGDTVYVRGGTYLEQVTLRRSGSAGYPITFCVYPGEAALVDAETTRNYGFYLQTAAYITIDGFEVARCVRQGIRMEATGNFANVRHCTVHDCADDGIYIRGADDVEVAYCEAYNCYVGIATDWWDTGHDYPMRPWIHHCLSHNNSVMPVNSDGIAGTASQDGIFEYNLCWDNADDGIDVSSSGGGGNAPERCIIRYNCAWGGGLGGGDGNGIKISTNAGGGHTVHHNIAFANLRSGFDCDQEQDWGPNRFYNNTAYGNGRDGLTLDMIGVTSPNSAAVVKNNLLFNNGNYDFCFGGTYIISESDYNLIGDNHRPPGEGPHTTSGVPLFVSPTATIDTSAHPPGGIEARWEYIWQQVQAHFALLGTSPCRNAGVEIPGITDGYLETHPDIGAREYAP